MIYHNMFFGMHSLAMHCFTKAMHLTNSKHLKIDEYMNENMRELPEVELSLLKEWKRIVEINLLHS